MTNLEIKAEIASFHRARQVLTRLGARRPRPTARQTDWYFGVPRGRLKLRRFGAEAGGELIAYARPDRKGARISTFVRLPVADCLATRRLLTSMFRLRVCVRKRREVWLLGNTRIHLDEVSGLGKFLEIEVAVTKGMEQARTLMRRLLTGLEIDKHALIGSSYGDLLASTRRG